MIDTSRATAAADRAYQHVKSGILDQTYAGGRLLTEGEVAAAVGVSRTPVREALLRLQSEGLLTLYPKKGALVRPVSAQEIADVLEARELVERYAATTVVCSPALLTELRQLLDAMRRNAEAGDPAGFITADRAFHRAVVAAAGNEIVTGFYDSLRDRQLRMGAAYMRGAPSVRMARALAEHAAILASLEDTDITRRSEAVAGHIASIRSGGVDQ